MASTSQLDRAANDASQMEKHVYAVDSTVITNKVRLRLKIDPEDGSVIHRDVDLDIDWNEINALEARMLANRNA